MDKTTPHHTGTLFVQGIPTTTKAAFKAACAKRRICMRDALIHLMRNYVAQNDRLEHKGLSLDPEDNR